MVLSGQAAVPVGALSVAGQPGSSPRRWHQPIRLAVSGDAEAREQAVTPLLKTFAKNLAPQPANLVATGCAGPSGPCCSWSSSLACRAGREGHRRFARLGCPLILINKITTCLPGRLGGRGPPSWGVLCACLPGLLGVCVALAGVGPLRPSSTEHECSDFPPRINTKTVVCIFCVSAYMYDIYE